MSDRDDRWEPVPIPPGDPRHDIGDDMRAAIVERLIHDWSRDPDLSTEKVRQLAMWAAASVRSLLSEVGTLNDLSKSAALTLGRAPQQPNALYERLRQLHAEMNTINFHGMQSWSENLDAALTELLLEVSRAPQRTEPEVDRPEPEKELARERTRKVELGLRLGQILGPEYDGVSLEEIASELKQLKAAGTVPDTLRAQIEQLPRYQVDRLDDMLEGVDAGIEVDDGQLVRLADVLDLLVPHREKL